MTFPRLTKEQMAKNLDELLHPERTDYTSEQFDEMLFAACANCPDPAGAIRIVVCGPSRLTTATALLDAMLSLPARATSDLPTSELSHNHPLRDITLV